jgi:hypothetical protein
MYFKKNNAQGAIEYLLIIGAAILVVAVVIIALTSVTGSGANSIEDGQVSTNFDQLEEQLADNQNKY